MLNVDTSGWTISQETPYEYDSLVDTPALAAIDVSNYLCVYEGSDWDGWSVILQNGQQIKP